MSNSGETIQNLPRTRIDIAIEALTLIGLILIPTVFRGREFVAFYSQPKFFVLHFVALTIAVLWLFELVMDAVTESDGESKSLFERADQWLARAWHRWTVIAVAGFGLTLILSTLLSPLPWVSVWGRDFGDLGYDLYSTLSYLVIFFAIALRTGTQAQLLRIALSIAAVGTFSAGYAVAQAFGWDPIGRGEGLNRVIASLGNPLFLGGYLVMSIPIVAALAIQYEERGKRWLLAPAAVSIGLHIAALWYAGGRGPWVAAIFGLATFVVASFLWLGWRRGGKGASLVIAGVVTAVVITSLPGVENRTGRDLGNLGGIFSDVTDGLSYISKGRSEPSAIELPAAPTAPTPQPSPELDIAPDSPDSGSPAPSDTDQQSEPESSPDTPIIPSPTAQPLETVGRAAPQTILEASQIKSFGIADPGGHSIGNRADIWRGALELALSRETVADESTVMHGLRILFGFGPDMYFYSYPNTTRPLGGFEANSHAHNFGLHVLMEQGLVGFLALVATAVLVLLTAVSVIRRTVREQDSNPWLAILLVGLVAALIGRAVEQGTGVGRVSDLVTFWALMGLVIAAAEFGAGISGRRRRTWQLSNLKGSFRELSLIGAVGVVAVVALLVFIQKDVNTMRAGWIGANAFDQKAASDANGAFESFQKASDLAPDVERYYTETAQFLSRTAAAADDVERSREFLEAARSTLLEYEKRDPLAWQTQLDLSVITRTLFQLGDEELRQEVINRYLNLSTSMKSFSGVQATAAANIVEAGGYELGIIIAERAIALESATQPLHSAWWALGEATYQLDRVDDAELAWNTAIDRYYAGPYVAASHRGLAFINEERGDLEQAAKHRSIAEKLDPR